MITPNGSKMSPEHAAQYMLANPDKIFARDEIRDTIAGLLEYIVELQQLDARKTHEINVLVHENRDLRAPWDGSVERRCEHKMRWVKGWYGDPSIPNGTRDCSGLTCVHCDWVDPKGERPTREE